MNKSYIIIFLVFILIVLNIKNEFNNIEKMTELTDQLDISLAKKYILDNKMEVSALRNFGGICKKILENNSLRIPGNIKFKNPINVINKENYDIIPRFSIFAFSGVTTPPTGWVECRGQNITLDGSTYRVPDIQNRFIFGFNSEGGKDPKVNGDNYDVINGTGGTNQVSLTVNELPRHNHNITLREATLFVNGDSGSGVKVWKESWNDPNDRDSNRCFDNFNNCNGMPHNNMPPFTVLSFYMKI